jgi:hypothetical protein
MPEIAKRRVHERLSGQRRLATGPGVEASEPDLFRTADRPMAAIQELAPACSRPERRFAGSFI